MEKQGAKAVHNGKCFEATTDLGFRLQNDYTDVLHQGEFYDYFGIVWSNFLSKKIVPDEVVVNHRTETIYIIEKKSKSVYGSDDEKLLAGIHFKSSFMLYCEWINHCHGLFQILVL